MVAPPFSAIEESASVSVTAGASSSSVIVPVPVAAPSGIVAFDGALSVTFTVSSGSWTSSPVTVTAIVLLVSSVAKVSVPEARAV